MAKQNGAPSIHSAPCVALQLKAASWSSDADDVQAFETRAAEAASRFGRVLDVRLASGSGTTGSCMLLRGYQQPSAVRFTCNGVTRRISGTWSASLCVRDFLAKAQLAREGVECGNSTVLGAYGLIVISFSTPSGAAAASIALDGAAFDGYRCAAFFGNKSEEPCCVLRGPLDGIDDDLSQMEVVGDVEEACAMLGEVRSVSSRDGAILIAYDENRGAAACARTMHGRVFDGREVGDGGAGAVAGRSFVTFSIWRSSIGTAHREEKELTGDAEGLWAWEASWRHRQRATRNPGWC